MSEFIPVMSGGGDDTQTTEHHFSRVLAGDPESVRERLAYALERLEYRVLTEQPLIARRGYKVSRCSMDVLKCVKSLTLGLKALNPTSTLVTFDYEILNSMVTKGDRQTIEREAEAIIALACALPATGACVSCGTANPGDSRFCRVCGTPNVASDPAEIEVLRLTSGARQAHQSITGSVISALAVAALAIPLMLLSSKGPQKGLTVLIVGEVLALCWLFYGMWRLHSTLNPTAATRHSLPPDTTRALKGVRATAALPEARAHASVTEGTTELLGAPERELEAVPRKPRKINTAEIQG
jgi:hypothetical protein